MFCKLNKISMLIVLMVAFVTAGDTGKIAGKITDEMTGDPLIGANVVLVERWVGDDPQPVDFSQGAATDMNGQFYILNIRPGVYSVNVNFIGYGTKKVTRVEVLVDKTTPVNVMLAQKTLEGDEVVVIAQRRNTVDRDVTATKQTYQIDDIQNIAGVADISDILAMQADVVDDHFRGGRVGESQYILGGGAIINPINNSRAFKPIVTGLEQVEVYTSGFSAEYGNAQSGVVNMVTKEGGSKWQSRLEFSATAPYYKVWEELANGDLEGGSPYSINSLDFFSALHNDEEWLKENPVYPGRVLYDPGYGFGPLYLPPRVTWPPNPLKHSDSLQIAHLGHVQWLMAIRDAGMEYDNTWDNRVDFTTGGPIADDMKIFIAGRQTATYCMVPTTVPDMNRQIMSSLVWQRSSNDKIKATLTLDQSSQTYFNSSFLSWLFDRTLATTLISSLTKQYGIEWKHVFNNSTFMDTKTNILDLVSQDRINLLNDGDYVTDYMKSSNWTDYTSPSNHRIGRPSDDSGVEKSTTFNFSNSLTSQINHNNLIKAGFQFSFYHIDVDNQVNRYGDADIRDVRFDVNPYEGAFYFQDKIEFEGLIANVGLRADFYQLDAEYFSDLYSPLRNPDYDPEKPYLERGPYYADSLAAKTRTDLYMNLQPRIGISFPVSEATVFHLNYGTFTQRPNFSQLFYNQVTINNEIEVLGNPRLKPEITNSYDIGIVKGIGSLGLSIDISAYYKDVKNLVQTAYYYDEQQSVYRTYINRDYADIKGFHVNVERQTGLLRGYVRYNYESATGKSSNDLNAPVTYFETPDPNYGKVDLPDPEDIYLDYDRTHKIVLNGRVHFGNNQGWAILGHQPFENLSLSATFRYMTGRPFTDPSQGKLFGERTPEETDLRMRFEKGFRIKDKSITFYVEGFNILNKITWNYSRTFANDYNTPRWFIDKDNILTYRLYEPYITSQDIYMIGNEPRHWRMGLIFKF
ncbi:MAG: TonB-dependent receptor [Candidatus Marinimicrobia bacterium]|nr:TonB-dependent receptor [Candidatus Neomarinimicrobiota bacterium]